MERVRAELRGVGPRRLLRIGATLSKRGDEPESILARARQSLAAEGEASAAYIAAGPAAG